MFATETRVFLHFKRLVIITPPVHIGQCFVETFSFTPFFVASNHFELMTTFCKNGGNSNQLSVRVYGGGRTLPNLPSLEINCRDPLYIKKTFKSPWNYSDNHTLNHTYWLLLYQGKKKRDSMPTRSIWQASLMFFMKWTWKWKIHQNSFHLKTVVCESVFQKLVDT